MPGMDQAVHTTNASSHPAPSAFTQTACTVTTADTEISHSDRILLWIHKDNEHILLGEAMPQISTVKPYMKGGESVWEGYDQLCQQSQATEDAVKEFLTTIADPVSWMKRTVTERASDLRDWVASKDSNGLAGCTIALGDYGVWKGSVSFCNGNGACRRPHAFSLDELETLKKIQLKGVEVQFMGSSEDDGTMQFRAQLGDRPRPEVTQNTLLRALFKRTSDLVAMSAHEEWNQRTGDDKASSASIKRLYRIAVGLKSSQPVVRDNPLIVLKPYNPTTLETGSIDHLPFRSRLSYASAAISDRLKSAIASRMKVPAEDGAGLKEQA